MRAYAFLFHGWIEWPALAFLSHAALLTEGPLERRAVSAMMFLLFLHLLNQFIKRSP